MNPQKCYKIKQGKHKEFMKETSLRSSSVEYPNFRRVSVTHTAT